MKKALFITYYFPPIIASGTNRSLAFSKLISEFNWEPIILSVKETKDPWVKIGSNIPEQIKINRSFEFNLAKIVDLLHGVCSKLFSFFGIDLKTNYFREYICIPDTQIAWFSTFPGITLASDCDLIYTSCSPFSSAISACLIKLCTKKPLVLDFRDAWSLNPHISNTKFHQFIIQILEKFCINNCDHLILNTNGALKLYQDKYPQYANKFSAIPNGYDKLTPVISDNSSKDIFEIMHIGSFYGKRSPKLLLQALAEINNPQISFHQVGDYFEEISNYSNIVKVTHTPTVTHDKALELMQNASLLYLKQGFEEETKKHIAVAAKTYEYLATGIPILAELPPGDNAEVISTYSENSYLVTTEDKDLIKKYILEAFEKRKIVKNSIKESYIKDFNRKNLTKKLAEIFNTVCKK